MKWFKKALPLFLLLALLLPAIAGCTSAGSTGMQGDTPAVTAADGQSSRDARADDAQVSGADAQKADPGHTGSDADKIEETGTYTSKEEVAAYLHTYGHLPDNFITKKQAKALGWVSSEGNLGEVAPGKSIGGDYFGNFEGNLPEKKGREYHECDIDSSGGYRGAKRIVFSNDGLIYYTEDHYKTFVLLYGEE